jgi:WD40 repeat protein
VVTPLPPLPPIINSTVSTPNNTDRLMIDQLSSWFGSIHISSAVARRYAELLVEKNSGSITKLQRKLERNVNYLEEIGGFDEDDIIDIKEGLKMTVALTGNNNGRHISPYTPGFPPELQEIVKSAKKELILPVSTVFDSQQNFLKEEDETTPIILSAGIPRRSRISSVGHSGIVGSLSWSPVGNKIASGSYDETIKIWDGKSLELLKTLKGHSNSVCSVSWNHDSSQIASGSYDTTIKIWDSSSGIVLHTLAGHSGFVMSVAWNHDSSKIVSGSADGTMKIWDCKKSISDCRTTWKLLKTLEGHSHFVNSVSWNHHDSSQIVSGSWDKTIKIWDSSTGILLRTLTDHSGWVKLVSWSHDDTKIVSGSYDKTVRIWNAITGDLMKTLEGHSGAVSCVAWSPDDRKIASCSCNEKKIILWDSLNGQVINTINQVGDVLSLAWSPDGNEIATNASDLHKIVIYSLA